MFDFWNNMFKLGRITADKLKEAVEKKYITADEYKDITGEEYQE
jgi:uncharacterized XkdX family phage protein